MHLNLTPLVALTLLLSLNAPAQSPPVRAEDYSGMYSFLREGEYIQITIEGNGNVSGFISRFGDTGSGKSAFLDQFLDTGKLNGNHLTFVTKPVDASWFSFEGTIGRGQAQREEEDGYYLIQGTLRRYHQTSAGKKTAEETRTVEFKSFPRD